MSINLALAQRFLEEAGGCIQIFRAADDLATQSGLLMSLPMYRARLKPYHRKYFDFVKAHTSAAILYHSCGNITNLIDDLVEIGVDAINPVQVSALPETAKLKAQFGDKVTSGAESTPNTFCRMDRWTRLRQKSAGASAT